MTQVVAQQQEPRWICNQRTGQLRYPDGRLDQDRGYSEMEKKMKKLMLTFAVALSVLTGAVAYGATATDIAEFEKDPWGFRWSRANLARDKAVEDIAANIPLLVVLRKDFGESAHLEWAIPIAEKLPSQPVAVVQLMTLVDNSIDQICPRIVIEDTIPFSEYKNWMERSATSLESFTMNDEKAETTRRVCLQKIKDALSSTKPW